MATAPTFPNYAQMRQPLPIRYWHMLRIGTVVLAFALCAVLVIKPKTGLDIWWGLVIPFLPLLFFVAPGLWRNLCPLAAMNQTPRVLGFTRGLTPPDWLKEYGYVIAIAQFLLLVPARRLLFNGTGWAVAALILYSLGMAFVLGFVFKGKSGWCSSTCPLLPIQRIYGQTPFVTIPNSHCQPCVGCTKNCYDFRPSVAYLADMYDDDHYFSGYRRLFVGAFPGFVLAFYRISDQPGWSALPKVYGQFAIYSLISLASFYLITGFLKLSVAKIAVLYGVAAINIYYYYNFGTNKPLAAADHGLLNVVLPANVYTHARLATGLNGLFGISLPAEVYWAGRAIVAGLCVVWIVRSYLKERVFLRELAPASAVPVKVAANAPVGKGKSAAGGGASNQHEVTFVPDDKRLAAEPGKSLLDVAEAAGIRIEAGCRMGMCGADPVAIVEGFDNLTPMRDDERTTIERLGLAENTRMACCARVQGPCSVSLKPERASVAAGGRGAFTVDPSVERVIVIGNGIAGVTAVDNLRRYHPDCEIHLIGRERHHLYNRMGIERLIYGRSAMQGLYLMPDSWYDEHNVTCWLNTRVERIDRRNQVIDLATGDRLGYDRLILATGSSSFVPPLEGFGLPGSYVLREADDAMEIRAFAQQSHAHEAIVAGGGLLGLEAAYALLKLGLRTTVLERGEWLLRRQLDQRGGQFLREYLEGLGLTIITGAESKRLLGDERLRELELADGRVLPCELFLAAVGITPNIDLAKAAGLSAKRGVIVDDHMRTSDPLIYAAGDVAEFEGQVYGLWPTAVEQGEIAAVNLLGGDKSFRSSVPTTMLKVVGIELSSVGRFERQEGEYTISDIVHDERGQRYRKLVIHEGKIVGAILLGYPADAPLVSAAVKQQVDVTPAMLGLRTGDFSVLNSLVR